MADQISYIPVGDQALLMEFGNEIKPEISQRIRLVMDQLEEENLYKDWSIEELIPTYRSILILYNPMKTDYSELEEKLKGLDNLIDQEEDQEKTIVLIPTLYGGHVGPDLDFVAENAGLSPEEVIDLHSQPDYLVYMLGFTPGFTYLGGLNPKLKTPRLEESRLKIPAGSVGIADMQTGIYPIDSPGGWQLIGQTPVDLYTPQTDPPVLIRAGYYVRFQPINQEEFDEIKDQIQAETYQVQVLEGEEEVDRG